MMEKNEVILVNEKDEQVGTMEKMEAHQKGELHRAFSVFIFNANGHMLLQQRSAEKYHGGLLWTNACCSHPYPGEMTHDAASRRLKEEMGFGTPLHEIFSFVYHAHVENNLVEHEFDHVFAGEYEGVILPDTKEVSAYRYQPMNEIEKAINDQPEIFTSWFKIAFPSIKKWWSQAYASS